MKSLNKNFSMEWIINEMKDANTSTVTYAYDRPYFGKTVHHNLIIRYPCVWLCVVNSIIFTRLELIIKLTSL